MIEYGLFAKTDLHVLRELVVGTGIDLAVKVKPGDYLIETDDGSKPVEISLPEGHALVQALKASENVVSAFWQRADSKIYDIEA